ncbi:hypothetical protein GCM10008968_35710 [Bacillus horti]
MTYQLTEIMNIIEKYCNYSRVAYKCREGILLIKKYREENLYLCEYLSLINDMVEPVIFAAVGEEELYEQIVEYNLY